MDENVMRSDVLLSFWEAADGGEFQFTRTEYVNGDLATQEEGTAKRAGNGRNLRISRLGQDDAEVTGTALFPIAYSRKLIETASRGEKVFTQPLFDGTEKGESPTTAFIGKTFSYQMDKKGFQVKGKAGAVQKAWPVRISYFEREQRDGLPNFEMGYVLLANGLATDLLLAYPDVKLKGTLNEVEFFDPGSC